MSAGYVSRNWMVSSKGQDRGNPIRQVCGQLNWKVGPIKSRESRIHDAVLSLKEPKATRKIQLASLPPNRKACGPITLKFHLGLQNSLRVWNPAPSENNNFLLN